MSRRGTTIVELLIAMGVALVILTATYQLFLHSRRSYEEPRAAMQIEEELMQVVGLLQRELAETDLQTVRSFPSPTHPSEPPGLSFESPRDTLELLTVGDLGIVRWQKYVYYTLVADPTTAGGALLIRKEGPLSDQGAPLAGDSGRRIPLPSSQVPSVAPGVPARQRIVAKSLQAGGATAVGFRASFPSPAGPQAFDANRVGQPVVVDLTFRRVSRSTGRVTVLPHRLQVLPRN